MEIVMDFFLSIGTSRFVVWHTTCSTNLSILDFKKVLNIFVAFVVLHFSQLGVSLIKADQFHTIDCNSVLVLLNEESLSLTSDAVVVSYWH
jgi:hypothetical protein